MPSVIDKQSDKQISEACKGFIPAGGDSTFITAVKTYLDANFKPYTLENGKYSVPHIRQATNYVLNKVK